ncbi:hypothetical protein WJX84_010638 [Apatococcus fuscideae]|uniref:Uncharacterized protein n=1 Tax=Apatococcus fuscideae TaxID=2026836 RepID=A0AAW1SUZ0_9CHLO
MYARSCLCEVSPVLTKWVYFILFAITALATWMLRDYSSKALSHVSVLKSCLGDGAAEDGTCVGKGAVLRISLGNVMFFAIMFLLTLGVTRKRDHCLPGLVIGTLVTFIGSLGVTGVLYYFYAPSVHCHLNIFFITITLILGIGYSILSVTPIRAANAGLLTSGCVLGYCVYLTWSALTSETVDRVCVHNGGTGSRGVKVILVTTSLHNPPELQCSLYVFYIVFLLGSAYMAMLFTGWSLNNTPGQFTIDYGWFSVWVKMASSWFSALLYVWTLIAPAILRNRNFS